MKNGPGPDCCIYAWNQLILIVCDDFEIVQPHEMLTNNNNKRRVLFHIHAWQLPEVCAYSQSTDWTCVNIEYCRLGQYGDSWNFRIRRPPGRACRARRLPTYLPTYLPTSFLLFFFSSFLPNLLPPRGEVYLPPYPPPGTSQGCVLAIGPPRNLLFFDANFRICF